MSLQIEVVSSLEEIQQLESTWDHLYSRSPNASMFMLWEWMEAFRENLEPPLKFLRFKDPAGETVALLPYVQGKIELNKFFSPYGIVFSLGHFAWPSHLDIVCEPGKEEEAALALKEWLQKEKWNYLSFRRFDRESSFLKHVLSHFSKEFQCFLEPPTLTPALHLSSSMDEIINGFTKSFRKKVTYENRRMEKNFELSFKVVETEEELGEIFNKFVELHTARIEGKVGESDLSSNPKIVEFHRSFCQKALRKGHLRMGYLKINGHIGAVRYDARVKDMAFYYNTGFDPQYATYSLGNVIGLKCLEKYLQEGVKTFNLLSGLEYYKFMWADHLKYDENVVFFRRSLKGKFYSFTHSQYQKLSLQVQQKEYEKNKETREKLQSFMRMEPPF